MASSVQVGPVVLSELARVLRVPVPALHMGASFTSNGGDSIYALRLSSALKLCGIRLTVAAVLQAVDLEHLVADAALVPAAADISSYSRRTASKRKLSIDDGDDNGNGDDNSNNNNNSNDCNINSINDSDTVDRACWTSRFKRPRGDGNAWVRATDTQSDLLSPVGPRKARNLVHYAVRWPPALLPEVKRAWFAALASEPIFSSRFEEVSGSWYFREAESFIEPSWREIVVVAGTREEYDEAVTEQMACAELDWDSNVCFTVLKPAAASISPTCTVVWTVHHALVDGWSRDILIQKVHVLLQGGSVATGPSFAVFASDLRAYQLAQASRAEAFWQEQNDCYGIPQTDLALPPPENHDDAAHGQGQGQGQKSIIFDFPRQRLQNTARLWRVGASSLYFTAWAVTLATLTNDEHVRFGAVFCGRNLPIANVDSVVGPLISTVPLTVRIGSFNAAEDLAKHVAQRVGELSNFSWTLPAHGYTRDFTSALSVQTEDESSAAPPPLSPVDAASSMTHFTSHIPLSVSVEAHGLVRIQYHGELISSAAAASISSLFAHALSAVSEQRLPYLGTDCAAAMPSYMDTWLRAQSQCYSPRTTAVSERSDLVSLFRRAAVASPADVAVEKRGSQMTYGELNLRSDLVARELAPFVSPGDVVGVRADRSLNWIVAIYAVLKVAGVYCPLHANLPLQVLGEQFRAAGSTVFVSPSATDAAYESGTISPRHFFSVADILLRAASARDEEQEQQEHQEKQAHQSLSSFEGRPIPANAPAYLCFTSGSSGKPKGVLCKHSGLVAFQRDFDVRLRARPGWRVAQTMSPSFDGSIHEIFSTLSYGATLVLADDADPFEHLQVDAAVLTPTVAGALDPRSLGRLQVVYLVGEAVSPQLADTWASHMTVFNMYGPTEATCGATIAQLLPGTASVTIGKPNPSTRLYILDRNRNFTPPGLVGEIYLAGVQVAAGYIGVPEELNRRCFVADTICPEWRETMYKTGDLAFRDQQGQVHILGRRDRQVKHRGFRLDLDDIESRVRAAVPEARGVAATVSARDQHLVVALTPDTLSPAAVRQQLATHLLPHAMPREIYVLADFPRTRAGKLDYARLGREITISQEEDAGAKGGSGMDYLELDPVEAQLADLWRNVLGLRPGTSVSATSNFIECGGESTTAVRLRGRIEREFGCVVSVRDILGTSNVRDLAERVKSASLSPRTLSLSSQGSVQTKTEGGGVESADECFDYLTSTTVSPMEHTLWQQFGGNMRSPALNVTLLCALGPDVDADRLQSSLDQALARHEVLRSQFHISPCTNSPYRLLSSTSPRVTRVAEDINLPVEINRPFALDSESLVRVFLSPRQLLIVAHHLICDLTALRTILRQARQAYAGEAIPPEQHAYVSQTFAAADPDVVSENMHFWDAYMAGWQSRPRKIHHHHHHPHQGTSSVFQVRRGFWDQVRSCARRHHLTAHQLLLAATALAVHDADDADDTVDALLGVPHMNRPQQHHEDMVGLFLQPLPVRITWPGASTSNDSADTPSALPNFLAAVKCSSEQALSHAVPTTLLRDRLADRGVVSHDEQLFDVMVTLHQTTDWDDCLVPGMAPRFTFTEGAKFNCLVEWTMGDEDADEQTGGLLRIEYRHAWADEREIELLASKMVLAVERILAGDASLAALRAGLRQLDLDLDLDLDPDRGVHSSLQRDPDNFLGVAL